MGANNEKTFKLNNNIKRNLDQSIKSTNAINERKTNLNKSKKTTNINNNKTVNLKQSIKSKYILIQILNNLKRKKLLKIIEHNKEYQTLLEINLENYKQLSGKIKIMESNGYGKEYLSDSMTLIFEGEYLNGQRNGKGTEYYDTGKLISKGII